MLAWLKSFFTSGKSRFPREVKDHWYCGKWYMYLNELARCDQYHERTVNPESGPHWAIDEVAFNHFRIYTEKAPGLIDGLIPAIQIGDKVGLYKQIGGKHGKGDFYDGAPWDDGYKIDLKFVRAIPVDEALETLGIKPPWPWD